MSQNRRHRSRRFGTPPAARRFRLPDIEVLEERRLLANVQWISASSGDWDVASNWSTDTVPGPDDDVTIDVGGATPTVTIDSGTRSVHSLDAIDPLSITGGALEVAADSTIGGALSMTGGSLTASGSGATLAVTGTTTISAASLYAQAGAALSLPQLTTYSNSNGYDDTYFEATGSGSVVSLPALTGLGLLQSSLHFQATQGGQVNASALATIASPGTQDEYVQIDADGAGSRVNLSGLTSLDVTNGDLTVTDQGTVLDGDVTTLSGMNVTLDGTGSLATGQWTSLDDGSVTLKGGSLSLNDLANVNSSNLYAQASASLTLPALTSYANAHSYDGTSFEATGGGAMLSLPNLTSLGQLQSDLDIQATQGGQVDAPDLDSIASPGTQDEYLEVNADGAGSRVNLSGLTSLDVTEGDLTVTDQGTVLDTALATLSGVDVTLDGTGSLATGRWTSLDDGSVTIQGGSYSFTNLANIDAASLYVQASSSLTLPALTSYANTRSYDDTYFEATGSGAVLSLPALASLGQLESYLHFQATQGGQVDAPAMGSIASPSTQDEYLQIDADGAGSQVNLSELADIDVSAGYLTLTNGGTLVDPGLAAIHNMNVTVGGGTYTFADLSDIDESSLYAQASATLALPALTSYANTRSYDDTYFEAEGSGAVLSLPALASLGQLESYLHFQATQGGQVNAPAMDSIANPSTQDEYLQVDADGAGSRVDLSGLTGMDLSNGYLSVTDQGTVLAPQLTTLVNVNATLDGTGTLATGQWTSFDGGSVTIQGGSYSFTNLANIDAASLYVQASSSLTLPALTSYANTRSYDDTYFEATGSGAMLSLPALASLGQLESYLHFQATQGGQVDAPAMGSIASPSTQDEYLQIDADGAGSQIDLSELTSIAVSAGYLTLTNGGTLLDPGLAAIHNMNVTVGGGTYSFADLSDIDESSLYAQASATLALPALTSYANTRSYDDTYFEATGSGAVLSLPALASLGQLESYLHFQATQGGQVDASAMGSIASPSTQDEYLQIDADGAGSQVNLSELASIAVSYGYLTLTNGGTLLDPGLAAIHNVNVTVGGGTYTFASLSDIDASSLYVQASGSLTMPALTSYSNTNSYDDTYFEATGSDAVLTLPALASLGQLESYLHFQATQGGQVSAPALDSIANPAQQDEYLQVYADGTGSQVNLPGFGAIDVSYGYITASDSGLVVMNTGTVALTGFNVSVQSSGTITAGTLQLLPSSTLSGDGTVTANVDTAGTTSPGSNGTATLTIDGNFAQYGDGSLDIQIGGLTAGTDFDQLVITGAATLGGTLDVGLINSFTPQAGNTFTVVTDGSQSGEFAAYTGLNYGAEGTFQTDYGAAELTLVGALAAIRVSPASGLVTSKGGDSTSFTVVLAKQPTANVTLDLSSGNTAEGTVSPSSLTFTSSDWDVPQTVTVTGVNDGQSGSAAYQVNFAPAVSTDANYSGLTAAPVSLTNLPSEDGEPPGVEPGRLTHHRAEPGVELHHHLGRSERRQRARHRGLGRPGGHHQHDDRRHAGDRRRPDGPGRGRPARPGRVDRPAVRLHPADRGRRHGQYRGHGHRQRR